MVSSRQSWPNSWTQNWAGAALTLLGPCDGCRVAQAKLSSPNAMGQIFYSHFFKTLDQMGSDGQPFWLKWSIGSCGKRWSSTSFSIVRSLLCKHAATERNCEHRHGVWQSSRPAVHDDFFCSELSCVSNLFSSGSRWTDLKSNNPALQLGALLANVHNICVALINSVAKTFMNRVFI